MKNLLQDSKSYYEENKYYCIFSEAEDYENKVIKYLESIKHVNKVLDAGCGTGAYLNTLENISNQYIGIDLSTYQLSSALSKIKKDNSILLNNNLTNIELEDNSVDLIVSCWVIGTIPEGVRLKALEELKRVLKKGGKIILVENDDKGEFEELRNHHIDKKTTKYNSWLIKNDFKVKENIETYFKFKDYKEAKECIENIYGTNIAKNVKSNKINHNIVIFEYQN